MLTAALCILFPALLVYAAFHDIATMTIPNWVSIALALGFLPAAYLSGLSLEQTGWHLAAGAIAFAVGAGLFFAKVWGGGDAKLIAAASLWLGFAAGGQFLYGVALAGGALALVLIVLRRSGLRSDAVWLSRLLSPEKGAPYAVAIAAGGIWAASASPVLSAGILAAGAGN